MVCSTSATAPVATNRSRTRAARRRRVGRKQRAGGERVGREAVELAGELRIGGHRRREQGCELALAEVVADRLAGDGGVAEHVEQVVAQLEGLAERERRYAVSGSGEVVEPAGERRTQVQRPLHGVLAGLVPLDELGPGAIPAALAVPARSRYWPTQSSRRSSSKTGRAAPGPPRKDVRVHEGEVADQDRRALAEAAGLAPPTGACVFVGELVWTAGRPRRRCEPSITSSCTSAKAWSSSRPAATSTTPGSSTSPPAPTNAHQQNAGRSRFPPAATRACNAPSGATSAGSTADQRSRSASSSEVIRRSTRAPKSPAPPQGGAEAGGAGHARRGVAPSAAMLGASVASARMAEFPSEQWIAELDAAARGADGLALADGALVLEQVVRGRPEGDVRYQVHVGPDGARVVAGADAPPTWCCSPTCRRPVRCTRARMRAQDALATGSLKVQGRPEVLARRAGLLARLDATFAPVRAGTTFPDGR